MNHEEANNRIIAENLGPLADQVFRTPPGSPTFSQMYGSGNNGGVQNTNYNNQQNTGYNNQQNNQGYLQNEFSGYGQPNPQYGQYQSSVGTVQQPLEWRMTPSQTASPDYYRRLPKVGGKAIVAVRKNGRGNIEAFKLEDGTILDYYQMLKSEHMLEGLRIQPNREGELIVRSVPDGYSDNNLDNLPNF
jgi:hypothetical protein